MSTSGHRCGRHGLAKAIAVMLATCTAAHAADGTWTNTAGGVWGTAGNWQGGVIPNDGQASLTLTTASYAVDYNAAGPSIRNLLVQNAAGKRTTLRLAAPLAHANGYIGLANADVLVTNGAVWTYPGINSTTDRLMDIANNATVTVCGGTVAFTNLLRASTSQRSWLNVGSGSTGALRVKSGTFDFSKLNSPNDSHVIHVGRSAGGVGNVEIASGAKMTLGNTTYVGGIGEGGIGRVLVAGDLIFRTAPYINVGYSGGYGELVVTNSGVMSGSGRWFIGGGGNCVGLLRFVGTGNMTSGTYGWEQLNVGFNTGLAGCSTGVMDITSGAIKFAGNVRVGHAGGNTAYRSIGTVNMSGGYVNLNTAYNTFIGVASDKGRTEGVWNMSGGSILINAGGNYDKTLQYPYNVSPWGYPISGLIIGTIGNAVGLADDPSPDTRAKGTLNLSGGAITNEYQFIVGCNGATGVVNQTGGQFVHKPGGNDTQNKMTLIGYGWGNSYSGAGHGTYNMSGGTYTSTRRVFVGGLPSSVISFSRAGGIGLLKLTGGAFTCNNTVYIGANGTGTLTIGNHGRLTCDNLNIENNTSGTLRFEVGVTNWDGLAKVNSTLTVAAGAKLQVDLAGFAADAGSYRYRLVDCATRVGSFAAGDITVSAAPRYRTTVEQAADGDIWLNVVVQRGTAVLVR